MICPFSYIFFLEFDNSTVRSFQIHHDNIQFSQLAYHFFVYVHMIQI